MFIGLPRKQGKTELAAAILLYLMLGTGKRDQQLYSASGDRDQAALIYRSAAAMVRNNAALSARLHCFDGYKRISYDPAGTVYQALSSDAPRKHGLRPSAILIDELHVLPNRDLFDALMTAFGATLDPLTIMITTAGWDRTSLCYEQWQYAEKVAADPRFDPSFLPILYQAKPDDDWKDEAVWKRVMPGLGDFCQLDFIRDECRRAQELPVYQNTFRQLYLNQWTEQAERWISVDSWAACVGHVDPAEMIGQPCYAGLDLGVTGDMSCLWLVWPQADGSVKCAGRAWAPREGKWRRELRNENRYRGWAQEGLLRFTSGSSTDHGQIKREIIEINERFPFINLFADRAYATQILNELYNDAGIPVKGIPQGSVTLNEACVKLEELVLDRQIEHGDNGILNWAIANASVERNTTGLMHPNKSSATERIDALSALINALAAYVADPEDRGPSVYETSGNFAL